MFQTWRSSASKLQATFITSQGIFPKPSTNSKQNQLLRPSTLQNTTIGMPYQCHSTLVLEKPMKSIFDLELHHGRCVGVEIDRLTPLAELSLQEDLREEEIKSGIGLPMGIRMEFLAGRIAMRRALAKLSPTVPPILRNRHGAPSLPCYVRGSISHKKDIAVALVRLSSVGSVGVDLELAKPSRNKNLAKRVMTERERQRSGNLSGLPQGTETLLHFSMKEALYKALHPHLHQYVGWQEAEVFPHEDGTFDIELKLKNSSKKFETEGRWLLLDNGMFLTTVHVKLIR